MKREEHKTGRFFCGLERFLLVFLLVLLLLPSAHVSAKTPAGVKAKGIDVSRWQGRIDWAKVKKDGIDFTMIGVGYLFGSRKDVDPQFTNNIQGATANGVEVGVYIYSHALTVKQAQAEADFVLKQIDGYKISYPVAFDIEDESQRKLTTKQRTDITLAFLKKIEAAGYHPVIYASESWLYENMDLSRLQKYDKWVARWSGTVKYRPLSMWQYSSTGKVKGISGPVDLDYDYRDYSKVIEPRYHAKKQQVKTGWQTDGKHYWYLDENGIRAKKGFLTVNGKKYYIGSDGYRASGWKKIGGKYYYFSKKTGAMQKGWLKVNGKFYYLNSKGQRVTGWVKTGGNKYYMNKDGTRRKGWLTLKGKKYLLGTQTGKMCTGWTKYQGKIYYFSTQTGQMRKGWLKFGEKKYYVKSDGNRASGWTKIKGKWYYFNKKDGVMKKNCRVGRYQFDKNGVCRNYRK